MKINPLLLIDGYKTDHRRQYPPGTEYVYSNLTARKSRLGKFDEVIFFGLQYFIQEYLVGWFDNKFFNRNVDLVCEEYQQLMDNYLGKNMVSVDHIADLWNLGYLPIEIKAVPEGTRVPIGVPMLTIVNTLPEFFWLTNQLETLMSSSLWQMITSATLADRYRANFEKYAEATGIDPSFIPYQGHDFSFRGMSSVETAMMSGAAHLTSFVGTDTVPAILFLEKYYGASGQIGASVPATEHSVMCMGGDSEDEQIAHIRRLITEVYPTGIVSLVADTWDFWWLLTEGVKRLKPDIEKRDGKVVFRPDSGDPVKIIVGNPEGESFAEQMGAYETLYHEFPGTTSPRGFRSLSSKVGLIYGDSITLERQEQISVGLMNKFFTPDIVLGIGSYTYQYNTRDTFGMAVKATWGQVAGVGKEIFKAPKTDIGGEKKSAKGKVTVVEDGGRLKCVDQSDGNGGLLETVFFKGELVKETTLADIRSRIAQGRKF